MDINHKLLVIDEISSVGELIKEIVNTDNNYTVCFANGKTEADKIFAKQRPDLILLNSDRKICLDIADYLKKVKDCPPFVIMGKGLETAKNNKSLKKLKLLDEIKLPFDIDDLSQRLEEACFMAEGLIDEVIGLYKKTCFEFKVNRLMQKKTKGVFFSISLNAYSFAANPSAPLQIQMSVFALKDGLKDGILGINGNVVLGFIPTQEAKSKTEARLNKLIETMHKAVEGPNIFTPAGAVQSQDFDFSLEDLFLYADRAMELSKNEGKNLIKFYK